MVKHIAGDVGKRFLDRWAIKRPVTPSLHSLDEVVRRCEKQAKDFGLCIAVKRLSVGRWRGYAARVPESKFVDNGRHRDEKKPGGEVVIFARVVYRVLGQDFASITEADAYGRTKARVLGERGFEIYRTIVDPAGKAHGSEIVRRVSLSR